MAKTPEQFLADLEATKQLLVNELPNIALKLTGNVKALAQKNIQEKGFGAQYSQQEIPVFFFADKALNSGGRAYLEDHGISPKGSTKKKRKKKGDGEPIDRLGNWSEFRAANGRQINWVDLSFSGQHWRGMIPLQPQVNQYIAQSKLGATNVEVQKEISYNYIRYGDYIRLALGQTEFEILQDGVIDDFFQIFSQKLL